MIGLLAHAAPINYKFPLPIWLYVIAGGAAVLLSAPAAALAVTESAVIERRGPDVYRFFRRARTRSSPSSVSRCILVALVGGLFSTTDESQEFFENPVLVLTWVDFWVGLGIVSWLVGNVWERVSPLNVAGRALDRLLARNGVEPLRYPAWLGQWPAVALLARLVVDGADLGAGEGAAPVRGDPARVHARDARRLRRLRRGGVVRERRAVQRLLAHALALLAARAAAVLARGVVGDAAVGALRAAASVRRGAAHRSRRCRSAARAFVLAALATVVFDGWSQTDRFGGFQQWFWERWSFLAHHVDVLQTLSMVAVVAIFVSAYLLITRDRPRRSRRR